MKPVRQRLCEAACELFYAQGYNAVGINEVIRTADVARMSLYNHFPSKEKLALAAFSALCTARQHTVSHIMDQHDAPEAALAAFFDLARELADGEGFRGCAFLNLAAQTLDRSGPLHALARMHKAWLLDRLSGLAGRAGIDHPELVAHQWLALWDGALSAAYLTGTTEPVGAARLAAIDLLRLKAAHADR